MATLSYTIDCNKTRRKEKKNVFTVQSTPISPNILCHSSPTPDPGYNPRRKRTKAVLLSNKDPLSIQITTINFNLVCYAIGDTGVHYAFYRPHPPTSSTTSSGVVTTQDASLPPVEDSVDYQGNLQAIHNLMGLHADTHAAITPMLSQLSILSCIHNSLHHPSSPHTFNPILLSHHVASSLRPNYLWTWSPSPTPTLTLPIPRPLAFFFPNRSLPLKPVPLTPRSFFPQHIPKIPVTQIPFRLCPRPFITVNVSLPSSHLGASGLINRLESLATLAVSTNSLTDRIWNAELREVELWENERCDSQTATRFASVVAAANAVQDANATSTSLPPSTSTSRIGRKLSESFTFSSSPSTSPTVKKAKKV
ncbi:hypothetical protein D9758_018444 [Tetrapyrgos nigripes]|uniref:Uncharacterized protein n=1 Tax=Tetrapyrgos nigripes TaxID=182062 RepID=A0A8H5F1G7_9AGAR|nr:hypothetical protein D9758_018444 [Tetrapyrgos nigripes]